MEHEHGTFKVNCELLPVAVKNRRKKAPLATKPGPNSQVGDAKSLCCKFRQVAIIDYELSDSQIKYAVLVSKY